MPSKKPPPDLGQVIAEAIEESALAGAATEFVGEPLITFCEATILSRFRPHWIQMADWIAEHAGSPKRGVDEAALTLRMVAERAAEKAIHARRIKGQG